MPFLFTNALFLAALAGLGIPVLIHLLLKRKSQRMRFSTIRFFAKHDEQASSKRRLRNLLLLLLRLVIFALIVCAFARPFLPLSTPVAANNGQRRQVVLVLDHSLSLQAIDSTGSRWANAQRVAREFLSTLKANDQAALVTCDGHGTIASGFAPAAVIAKTLAELPPGSGATDLGDGLREAARLVSTSDPKAAPSIVIISDLQRSSVQNLPTAPLPEGVQVQVLPVGDLAAANLSVVELNLEPTSDEALPHAVISHRGDDDIAALETELLVDGQSVLVKTLPLKAGTSTNLDLHLPVLKAGWHNAEFRLRTKDALLADNSRFQSFYVAEPISVLLVEGRARPRSFEEQTFFVAAALDPSFGTTNAGPARFALSKTAGANLPAVLGAKAGIRPTVVVMPAQPSVSGTAKIALAPFVENGGGLLLFVGDEISAGAFNTDFNGLSPVALKVAEKPVDEFGWHIGNFEKDSPLFAPFRQPNSGNLALPMFMRRYAVTPTSTSTVLARFEDGTPFVVGATMGRGRVVFVNTTADSAWSDWPKHKSFVPWLQNAIQYLAGRHGEAQLRVGANLVAGTDEEFDLGAEAKGAVFQLAAAGGQPVKLTADPQGHVGFIPNQAGFHTLADSNGKELKRFSVNLPASESDLAALRPGEFQAQIKREGHEQSSLAANLFGSVRNQKEFWRVLLFAALALLFVETIFANRSHA